MNLFGNSLVCFAIGLAVSAFAMVGLALGEESTAAPAPAASQERWVGHQVVYGNTQVPFMGEKQTRTDSYLLADVKRKGNTIALSQMACKVTFKEIAGVKVDIPTRALLRLPKAEILFESRQSVLKAAPWSVGWRSKDIDRDGSPGLSISVDASVCSGKLYVSSNTQSIAVAKPTSDGIVGKIKVHVKQKILGSDNLCLRMFSSDTEEHQTGGFAYRRVSEKTTCEHLLSAPWPVEARVSAPKPEV